LGHIFKGIMFINLRKHHCLPLRRPLGHMRVNIFEHRK
jgi:hypothetical protein